MSKNKRKSNVPAAWLANVEDQNIFEYKNANIENGKLSGELCLKKLDPTLTKSIFDNIRTSSIENQLVFLHPETMKTAGWYRRFVKKRG